MTLLDSIIAKLTDMYNKSPLSNIGKLFSIYGGQLQELRDTLDRIALWKDIDQAQGATLDNIGTNVAQLRGQANDDVYRILIKSKIARNLSKGDINTLIAVIALATGAKYNEIDIQEKYTDTLDPEPAAISLMRMPLEVLAQSGIELGQFVRIIQRTVAAGVRVQSIELAGTFEFGGLPAETDPAKGWGDVNDPTVGGTMGAAYSPGTNTDLPI
jgi:hypothetical protein